MQKFIINIAAYVQNQSLTTNNINAIAFYNTGSNSVIINNSYPLAPGGVFAVDGNAGEVDETKYSFIFVPGAGTNTCVVVTKEFI
jgi:hypothetical protein